MRSGRRLRVVLDGEGRHIQERQPFDDAVVEVDVADVRPAEGRTEGLARTRLDRRVNGEPVVVRGDLDPSGDAVLDRLVDAAVAVAELVGPEPERASEDLVAEADAEHRDLAAKDRARERDAVVGGRRVTRSVGQEHAVGADREDVVERRGGGQDVHLNAPLRHAVRRHRLDARSTAATVSRLSPTAGTTYGCWVVTSPQRSAPAISGEARTRSSNASASLSTEDTPTRMAPRSRR